jgi:hypothetical protein
MIFFLDDLRALGHNSLTGSRSRVPYLRSRSMTFHRYQPCTEKLPQAVAGACAMSNLTNSGFIRGLWALPASGEEGTD